MISVLYVVHILLCLFLMLIVLIQAGKGSGVGLSIGGGMSQTMFGGSGGRTFFMKLTTGVAAAFLITCLILARAATRRDTGYHGVVSGNEAPAQPAAPAALPTLPAGK